MLVLDSLNYCFRYGHTFELVAVAFHPFLKQKQKKYE